MKILHTADMHLGQVLYQNYDRRDEHEHFFSQLTRWCQEENPDALLVSGDIFDIQQPSASTKKVFNDYFADLHRTCPMMKIVIVGMLYWAISFWSDSRVCRPKMPPITWGCNVFTRPPKMEG